MNMYWPKVRRVMSRGAPKRFSRTFREGVRSYNGPGAPCKGEGVQSRCIGTNLAPVKVVATGVLSRTLLAISGKSGQVPAAAEVMKLPG